MTRCGPVAPSTLWAGETGLVELGPLFRRAAEELREVLDLDLIEERHEEIAVTGKRDRARHPTRHALEIRVGRYVGFGDTEHRGEMAPEEWPTAQTRLGSTSNSLAWARTQRTALWASSSCAGQGSLPVSGSNVR